MIKTLLGGWLGWARSMEGYGLEREAGMLMYDMSLMSFTRMLIWLSTGG